MKKQVKVISIILALCMVAAVLSACTAVQVSGKLVINADDTGSRQIVGLIAKQDDNGDGYGSCYYYFKQHGEELQAKLADIYASAVEGSSEWLHVDVDDSGDTWEAVTLSFDFTSIEDYAAKLKALAYDAAAAEAYADPTFTRNDDGTFTYTESGSVMTAIFKSLQTSVMADETLFDPNCTKDGTAQNTAASLEDLTGSGVELMKPENGEVLTIQVDGGEDIPVPAENGVYTFTGTPSGEAISAEHETSKVLHYGFDDVLTNAGTAADNDLTYGVGSTDGGPTFEKGVVGNGIKLDGASYLASPNKDYAFKEMTVSFYYRMDAYTETDTGANMVIVPAGLGALNGGVVDVEFIKETTSPGAQLLAKMNSADWMTQDKLYTEDYVADQHLNEWHHYAVVYQNEYEDGEISDAFVYIYIDGKLAARSRLSVAAGLTYSLGTFDDGSFGEPNGGFNVGGYFEADQVKRGCTGCLDELMVFDGALSQEEINSLCYTVKVDKEYDPDATEETTVPEPTAAPTVPADSDAENTSPVLPIVICVVIVAVAAVAAVVLRKKKA